MKNIYKYMEKKEKRRGEKNNERTTNGILRKRIKRKKSNIKIKVSMEIE